MIGMMVSVSIGGIGTYLVPHADYAAVVRLTVFAAIAFVSLVLVGVAFVSMGVPPASPPPWQEPAEPVTEPEASLAGEADLICPPELRARSIGP